MLQRIRMRFLNGCLIFLPIIRRIVFYQEARYFLLVSSECSMNSIIKVKPKVGYAVLQFCKSCITNLNYAVLQVHKDCITDARSLFHTLNYFCP